MRSALWLGILLTIFLPTFFVGCASSSNQPSAKTSAATVLTLITTDDPTGSFTDFESTLAKNLNKLSQPLHQIHRRIGSVNAFRAAIASTSQQHGLIDTLILAFHGSPGSLRLGQRENLNQRNLTAALDQVESHLAEDAHVLLYACLTGANDDNLAADLATALKCSVTAPRYFWLMQRAVPLPERIAELTLNDQGQLCIDDAAFSLYYKARLESGRDRYLIAPKSMERQCRADGFLPQSSRFRSLFDTFRP